MESKVFYSEYGKRKEMFAEGRNTILNQWVMIFYFLMVICLAMNEIWMTARVCLLVSCLFSSNLAIADC